MTTRDRKILLILAGAAVLAGFGFFVLQPKRSQAGDLTAQIAQQQERLQTARQTVALGQRAKADYPRDYATVAQLGTAVPADDDLPSLLYQLDAASRNARVAFDSLVRTSGTSNSSNSSSSSSANGSGTGATAGAASATLPPGATVGTAGLATLSFTFEFTGSYFDLQRFVGDVQRFVRADGDNVSVRGRLLTVDGISLVPAGQEQDLSRIEAKLVATAYLSPDAGKAKATPDAAAGATGTAPAPGPSASSAAPAPSSSAITGGSN
jgi:Tfp pilus assembly protein PilO